MKFKRLISLALSAGILSSSVLSSGAPLFAMFPSQSWNLETWVKEAEKSGSRLCLSKDLSTYDEPISKEFFEHMVDTMEKIAFESGDMAEAVEDSGYIADVLLANSSLSKSLYMYPDRRLKGSSYAFDRMSNEHLHYSLYDSLFAIYLFILRMYSCPIYRELPSGKKIHRDDPFDSSKYGELLNSMLFCEEEDKSTDIVDALNYNFLLAKVLINKYRTKCARLKQPLDKLENFMKEIYVYNEVDFKNTSMIFEQIINNPSMRIQVDEGNGNVVVYPHGMQNPNQVLTYCKAREFAVFLIKIEKLLVRGCFMRTNIVSNFRSNEEIARSRRMERKRLEEIELARKKEEKQKEAELKEKNRIEREKRERIFEEIKLKKTLKKEELKKQKEEEKKAMEESAPKKSDEELKKENEEVQNEQFRCFCESECARNGSARKRKSKKSSKSKNGSQKVDTKESTSSSGSASSSSSGSVSSSESPEIPEYNFEDIFETEGNNEVEMNTKDAAYKLYYEPSLFSNLEEKNDSSTFKNIKKGVMEMIFSLHVGGTRCVMERFGKKRVINMSGCGQAKVDLYKRYANKLEKLFEKGSEPVLYKFKVNCTKECRIAYFVDDKNKMIYVTDNIEHIDKGEKH